jgi:hypothetical protein
MVQANVVETSKLTVCIQKIVFANGAVCEITWENTVQPGRPQKTIWYMRIAFWIIKATDTHSKYVILIAFPLQKLLLERTSMLFGTYIVCVVVIYEKCCL